MNNKITVCFLHKGGHFEILYSQCMMLSEVNSHITPIFFVDNLTYKQFSKFHKRFKWHILHKNGICEYSDIFSSCDLVILDITEIGLKEYVNFNFSAKVVLRIHNINYWLSKDDVLLMDRINYAFQKFTGFNKDSFSRSISALMPRKLRLEYSTRMRLLKSVNYITFCDETLYNYAKKQGFNCSYLHLPTGYYIRTKIDYCYNSLKIVIPGQVSMDRRDYNLIIDAFSNIKKSKAEKIECTLLGDASTKESIKIVGLLQSANIDIKIRAFKGFIDQDEYVKIMLQSHIILNPIKLETWYRGMLEHYSLSKTSGAYGDVMRYGLVPFFPKYYKVPIRIEHYFERYTSAKSLAHKLSSYTDFNFLNKRLMNMHAMLKNENSINVTKFIESIKRTAI